MKPLTLERSLEPGGSSQASMTLRDFRFRGDLCMGSRVPLCVKTYGE
jgi:hypothetical protein